MGCLVGLCLLIRDNLAIIIIKQILYHWLLSTTVTERVAIVVLVYKNSATECVVYALYYPTQDINNTIAHSLNYRCQQCTLLAYIHSSKQQLVCSKDFWQLCTLLHKQHIAL